MKPPLLANVLIMEPKMKRTACLLTIFFVLAASGAAEVDSLSQVFVVGRGLKDTDQDHLADAISFVIVVPDQPSAAEMALASDIAARFNFESLSQDLDLVKRESELQASPAGTNRILIGSNLRRPRDLNRRGRLELPALESRQGAVILLGGDAGGEILVTAGSAEALLETGRAFFLRWPYIWEIWGREDGLTYFTLENDLNGLLKSGGIAGFRIVIRAAFYDFPKRSTPYDTIKRLKFDSGEIRDLRIEIHFSDLPDKEKARAAVEALRLDHRKGLRTEILSYPGCARITLVLEEGGREAIVTLPRMGLPKRILTPGYKEVRRRNAPEKDFDLASLLSIKGLYADGDQDGLPDGLESPIIIPGAFSVRSLAAFASRLVLHTAGASFPLVRMEDEVEDIKTLSAPILVGDSRFCRDLVKTGRLKLPALKAGWAVAAIVPKAFNKSNVLALQGADSLGLEKLLGYLGRTFPYLEEYREGGPQLADVAKELEKFLRGESGSAEAFAEKNIRKIVDEIRDKELDSVEVEVYLPEKNPAFQAGLEADLKKALKAEKIGFQTFALKTHKTVFSREKEFSWEADDALALLEEQMKTRRSADGRLEISLGVSESPSVRKGIRSRLEARLREAGFQEFEVEVGSAYKQGFFWLMESVLPRLRGRPTADLMIRFAEEKDDPAQVKRFYAEPLRWLQELYPADDLLAAELGLPVDRIRFEMKDEVEPIYEVVARDSAGSIILKDSFSPTIRQMPYLKVVPEWGLVRITTGWLSIHQGSQLPWETLVRTDLEKFWDFYQAEILTFLYGHIMKKTGNEPSTSKQPYFKRLSLDIELSEPDYRLGLDEEMVSSLEAIHDEIYFDTLDFLRGITKVELEDEKLPEDTSRLSAPGNIFPVIHPSLEGGAGRVRVTLEDWPALSPQVVVKWKEKGRTEEHTKKTVFPTFKPKFIRFPSFIYDGNIERIQNLTAEVEFDKEADYLELLEIVQNCAELDKRQLLSPAFSFPRLRVLTLRIKCKDLEKEEAFEAAVSKPADTPPLGVETETTAVTTTEIISPDMCLEIVRGLGRLPNINAYNAGFSYENRAVPVLEIFSPHGKYVSLPRLVAAKPTLFISARQHANEVSSTNYILKFAELLATDEEYKLYIKEMNFVLEPMENPDGAALAYELQKLTPFHSLHAGRYGSLGIDIGYQVRSSKPFLPEAAVRKNLQDRWLPDIFLNLHGYPSHEWVQAFSGYTPYLFRDYWIPKGWFAYYRALRLPIYDRWKEAGDGLRRMIVAELQADEKIRLSNEKFYDRYWRWAGRWQPHLDPLELHNGLNIYAARRSPQENKLTPRTRITYIDETPELMDETARGEWLGFLCEQGLAYLRAHAKYLSTVRHEVGRIDEEVQDRIRLQFIRTRPGKPEPAVAADH
jgi:hypothetical protein